MGELAVHLVGDGALLQHDDDVVRPLGNRRDMQVDQVLAGIARRAEVYLVLIDRGAARTHLIDQREQRAAERHQFAQHMAPQQRQGGVKKRLRRGIGVCDPPVRSHHQHGMRQRIENGIRRSRGQRGHRLVPSHAARLCS